MLQAYGNPFVLRRARLYLKTHVVYAAQNPAMTYDLVVGCKTWSCSRSEPLPNGGALSLPHMASMLGLAATPLALPLPTTSPDDAPQQPERWTAWL